MKYFLYIAFFSFFLYSCGEKDNYHIQGKIKNLDNSTLYFVTRGETPETLRVDSIQCSKDGKFSFEAVSDGISPVIIYMNSKNVWITVWVKNKDKITISGDAHYPELILAKGGSINDLLAEFKQANEDLLKESRDLADRLDKRSESPDTLGTENNNIQIHAKLSNIDHQLKEKAEDFVTQHPSSVASLILLKDYLIDYDDSETLDRYLSLLKGDATQYPLYNDLVELNNRIKSTSVGSVIPDFTLVNIKGDTLNPVNFEGKYLLMNFAASWCGDCNAENQQFIEIRKQFNPDVLEMMTISLDKDVSTWKKLATDNGYGWNQVVEPKGWDSPVVLRYNVTSLPANLLIDKNKKIIAKNVRADSIQSIIQKEVVK